MPRAKKPVVESKPEDEPSMTEHEAAAYFESYLEKEQINSLSIFAFCVTCGAMLCVIIGGSMLWGIGGFLLSLGVSLAYLMYWLHGITLEEKMNKLFLIRDHL